MRAWPLILRELREQSRRPLGHWLRMGGAATLLAGVLYESIAQLPRGAGVIVMMGGTVTVRTDTAWLSRLEAMVRGYENRGWAVFAEMNIVLLVWIWLVCPMLTADCLSRERREGTLGLLFMAPLRGWDVVLAKMVAHGLRAAAAFVASLPLLVLPVLLGGVTWLDAARAALIDAGALALALSAGMRASSLWQGPRAVFFGALAIAVATGIAWLCLWAGLNAFRQAAASGLAEFPSVLMTGFFARLLHFADLLQSVVTRPGGMRTLRGLGSGGGGLGGVSSPTQLVLPALWFLLALGLAVAEMVRAARGVSRTWLEGRPRGLTDATETLLARPLVSATWLKRQRNRLLGWNPLLWAEFRTWRVRTGTWLTLLFFVVVEVWWVKPMMFHSTDVLLNPRTLLVALAALSAATCFQGERGSGVLELLLTGPGGAKRVLTGRLGALAFQVLPSVTLVVLIEGVRMLDIWSDFPVDMEWLRELGLFVATLVARLALAMGAGALFSLRIRTVVPAVVATFAVVIASAWLGQAVGDLGAPTGFAPMPAARTHWTHVRGWLQPLTSLAVEAGLALAFLFLLHRALAQRRFVAR